MKLFKKLFTKQPSTNKPSTLKLSSNDTQKLTNELEKLQKLENKYKNKLDELVEEKILLQIKINELNKLNQECINCSNLNDEIKRIGNTKRVLNQKLKNLKTAIKIEKGIQESSNGESTYKDIIPIASDESFPELEKYFIANGRYYLLDKEANLYVLTKCNNFKQFMEEIVQEQDTSFDEANIQEIIAQYFKRNK